MYTYMNSPAVHLAQFYVNITLLHVCGVKNDFQTRYGTNEEKVICLT